MKIDATVGTDLNNIRENAMALEQLGYDGIATIELAHDPFLPLTLAAEHTSRVEIMTGIAVSFARNPMLLANLAHDLNAYSKGRFTLGLGSQIKPHITKRFSMPWSSPAARMKEMVEAIQAIWANWYDAAPLHHKGAFYEHSLMTPMFTPQNTQFGKPKITLAAVGPKMTETAAAVADGMIIHAFSTEKYIREVTLPTIDATLAETGRQRSDFQIYYPIFTVTGETEEKFNEAKTVTRKRIAFYGSTPAYRRVLEVHGWGELQSELNRMSKIGQWDEMGELIDDDMLAAFAVIGEPEAMAQDIKSRYGDIIDRIKIDFTGLSSDRIPGLIDILRTV